MKENSPVPLLFAFVIFMLFVPYAGSQVPQVNVLHSFGGTGDGTYPPVGLVLDSAGVLYGTTCSGGSTGSGSFFNSAGHGIVFTLSPSGST